MDFDYSEEQQLLGDSLKKYLGQAYDFESRKKLIASASGHNDAAWATFAEMGLTAIPFAPEDGGFGGGAVDLMAAMEAFGEALVVEPMLDNIGLAGRLVAKAGSAAQRQGILSGMLEGSAKLAFASFERGRRYALDPINTTGTANAGGWLLNGEKVVVVGAPVADTLIVSARTGQGASLFAVPAKTAGVTLRSYRTVDGQRAADITFNKVQVSADSLLGADGAALPVIEEAVDFATALVCADAVGAMKSANDATLEYLKTRKQFGAPIGANQVLQHRVVDMYIACEQSRSMAIWAACKVDALSGKTDAASVAERKAAVSQAMVLIADSARLVSQESVQLHGGMGMTEELKVSHTFRRLTVLGQRFGDADHHLARYATVS